MKMDGRLGLHTGMSSRSAAAVVGVVVGIIDGGSDACVFRGDSRKLDLTGRQGHRGSSSLSTILPL